MSWFAHLKCRCGTFKTPQETNLLARDVLAPSNLDYYNRHMLLTAELHSKQASELNLPSTIILAHAQTVRMADVCFTTRSSNNWLLCLADKYILLSTYCTHVNLPTTTLCLVYYDELCGNACMLSVLKWCSYGLAPRHLHHRCYYALVGRAPEAYGSRSVCVWVCPSLLLVSMRRLKISAQKCNISITW